MNLKAFYIKYSTIAGILFSAVAISFLALNTYTNMWLIYAGNILFSAAVFTGVIRVNHLVHDNASIPSMTMVGLKITFYGILIASVICLLALIISNMVLSPEAVLDESPAQAGSDPRGDVVLVLFMCTVLVNATLGALAAVVGAAVSKRNQKTVQGKSLS